MIRPALLLGLLSPLATAPETLRVAPEKGLEVSKAFTSTLDLELEEFRVEVNGEEQEGAEGPEVRIQDEEEILFTDRYVASGDDGPTEIVRTFETLRDESRQAVTGPDGEEQEEGSEGESELEGVAVRFRWDADDEEWATSFVDEGEKLDAALLAELRADADFGFLLPEDDVDVGDSWKLGPEVFDLVGNPGGDLKIRSEDDDPEADAQYRELFRENLGGELEATLVSVEDGVATVEIEGEVETTVTREPELPEGAPDDLEVSQELQFHFQCEGTLVWDLERGVAVSLEFGGAMALELTDTQSRGEDLEIVVFQGFEGTWGMTAQFE